MPGPTIDSPIGVSIVPPLPSIPGVARDVPVDVAIVGGVIPPSATYAGPVVANEAALVLLALASGQSAFVLSQRAEYVKANGTPGVDVPALKAHEVLASSDGTGVFIRTAYSDPLWRLGIAHVYISSTGSAEARGIYDSVPGAPAPITGAELARRWGQQNTLRGPSADDTLAPNTIVIHVVGAIVDPDFLELDVALWAGTVLEVRGEATTVVLAGALDAVGGFTAENPGAAGGGTRAIIKSGATVWTPHLGRRIRFTATGIVAGIAENLGGGQAAINAPSTSGYPTYFGVATLSNPANGAAFVVEDLVSINMTSPRLTAIGLPAATFGSSLLQIVDVDINSNSFGWQPLCDGDAAFIAYQSTFSQNAGFSFFFAGPGANCEYQSCIFRNVAWSTMQVTAGWLAACLLFDNALGGDADVVFASTEQDTGFGFGIVSTSTLFQGMRVSFKGACLASDFAVFGTTTSGAVLLGGHSTFEMGASCLTMRGRMWGANNAAYGFHFQPNCKLLLASTPNITGALGNVAPTTLILAQGQRWWWFDDDPLSLTVGTYQPLGGISPLTWANLVAARGVAGFGQYAHQPSTNCHICFWNTL